MYYRGRKSLTLEQNDVAPTERKRERLDEREREREREKTKRSRNINSCVRVVELWRARAKNFSL